MLPVPCKISVPNQCGQVGCFLSSFPPFYSQESLALKFYYSFSLLEKQGVAIFKVIKLKQQFLFCQVFTAASKPQTNPLVGWKEHKFLYIKKKILPRLSSAKADAPGCSQLFEENTVQLGPFFHKDLVPEPGGFPTQEQNPSQPPPTKEQR